MTYTAYLNNLNEGCSGIIQDIPHECSLYNRLSDLGIINGSPVKCVRRKKGTAAYSIRQSVFAMRDIDTDKIRIQITQGE